MMDANYVTEQNKIASSGAWIWLLEIITPGLSPTTLRYTNDNARSAVPNQLNIEWNGYTYWSMPFTLDDVSMSTSGEFPEYKLVINELSLTGDIRSRVASNAGLVGSTVRLMVVHSDHLDLPTPAIDELAEILNCEVTADAVVFMLGVPSLLSRRFPRDKYVPSFCRHKFGGALCQYVQPAYSRTTSNISFIPGAVGVTGIQYNTIQISSGRLIEDVFRHAPGAYDGTAYNLTKDTGFTVNGSLYNDGFFLANSRHAVNELYVRVFMEADGARAFVEEPAGALITIQLGYNACKHTLGACKLRNNTKNYGGSPGITGGMYG